MNVSNDSAATNYVDYFTKQLPVDLANMAALRDEIAKRQGAMTAVEEAIKTKAEADAYYLTTKESCDKMAAEAKEINDKAKSKKKELDDREKSVDAKEKAHAVAAEAHAKSSKSRDDLLAAERAVLNEKADKIEKASKMLAEAEASLNARVKAFQDKVAQITA